MKEEKLNSKYLIDEHPITFHPTLALAIGVNEAILLQKINLWLNCKPHNADGRSWIYNTYKSWQQQLPFWSESTIKRIIKNLFDMKILIKGNYNDKKFDNTLWYSIDYEKLDEIVKNVENTAFLSLGQNDTAVVSNWYCGECQNDITNTNDYTMNKNNIYIGEKNSADKKSLTFNYDGKQISIEEMALEIYKEYPRKEGKADAIKHIIAYLKGTKKVNNSTYKLSPEQIVNAIMNYTQNLEETGKIDSNGKLKKDQVQYVLQASTFFNGRLLDYLEEE